MANYDWKNYNFTDADKARLAYIAQRLVGTPFMDRAKINALYTNPMNGEFDRAYGASYPVMDNRAINNTLNALVNRYPTAIDARGEINSAPREYRNFYADIFGYGLK